MDGLAQNTGEDSSDGRAVRLVPAAALLRLVGGVVAHAGAWVLQHRHVGAKSHVGEVPRKAPLRLRPVPTHVGTSKEPNLRIVRRTSSW